MTTLNKDKFRTELKKRTLHYIKQGLSMLEVMEKVAFSMQKDYGIPSEPIMKKIKQFRLNINRKDTNGKGI